MVCARKEVLLQHFAKAKNFRPSMMSCCWRRTTSRPRWRRADRRYMIMSRWLRKAWWESEFEGWKQLSGSEGIAAIKMGFNHANLGGVPGTNSQVSNRRCCRYAAPYTALSNTNFRNCSDILVSRRAFRTFGFSSWIFPKGWVKSDRGAKEKLWAQRRSRAFMSWRTARRYKHKKPGVIDAGEKDCTSSWQLCEASGLKQLSRTNGSKRTTN